MRVVDFSQVLAGPYAATMMAFMGAEVIKIESRTRVDIVKRASPTRFHDINLSKMSITLNIRQPGAVEIVKKLVSISDVVIQNFRPGVMERLGLGYDVLRAVRPDLVMLSLSGFGAEGPERHYSAYAAIFGTMGGLAHITGYPDAPPTEERGPLDLRTGQFVAFAILAAILHRRKTGEGQYIDLAARDGITSLIGDVIMDYTMNQRSQSRKGNLDDFMAPHNCYPCKGQDKWVSIAVKTDEEWEALCNAMGMPELSKDPRFADSFSRWQNQEDLDKIIGGWTSGYTHYEVMHILQKAGVAAVPSFNSEELFKDPHLNERGFIIELEHPELGKRKVFGAPWKFANITPQIKRGPMLGQHNEYVFSELLGFSEGEIAELQEKEVLN